MSPGLRMRSMPKLADLHLLDFGSSIQLAGCLYVGQGRALLARFPDETSDLPPVELLDMDLADWQKVLLQTDLQDTEVSARDKDGTVVKAIARKSARQIAAGVSWAVFRRDGYACRYCADNQVPLTVDHLVCWEEGGPSIEANLLSSCRQCNRERGTTPYEKWLRHPYYCRVARALSQEQWAANEALVATLASIPRLPHIKTRK